MSRGGRREGGLQTRPYEKTDDHDGVEIGWRVGSRLRGEMKGSHPHPFDKLRTGSIFPRQGGRGKSGGGVGVGVVLVGGSRGW